MTNARRVYKAAEVRTMFTELGATVTDGKVRFKDRSARMPAYREIDTVLLARMFKQLGVSPR